MGEGRGHASRARAMVELLRSRHRIVLYTHDEALAFLRTLYADCDGVEVRETAGLKFHYTGRTIDFTKTIAKGLEFRWNLEQTVRQRAAEIRRDRCALVITDFEPTVPRAAHRCGVPVLSLDHQHVLLTCDLSQLPWRLRAYAASMRPFVRAFGLGQQRTIVSAFYRPPLRRGCEDVVQVGPLLRPAVRQATPSRGGFVLSYLRPTTPPQVVDMLAALDRPVRLYGLGERAPRGPIEFRAINEQRFVDDLAASDAVVAAAGNQLLGEALHFGKPVFAIPERKHYEQCINAAYLKLLGGGGWVTLESLQPDHLHAFFRRLDEYRQNLRQAAGAFDGTQDAVHEIEAFLASRNDVRRCG